MPEAELLRGLGATPTGLMSAAASRERVRVSSAAPKSHPLAASTARLLASQFTSPIVLILLAAAGVSLYVGERTDPAIIIGIVVASGLLGFWQEHAASDAVRRLLALVHVKATVLRDGARVEVPVEEVVRGDVVLLSAGAGVPGDCRILEAKDLFVDEAPLTGESFPVEKEPGTLPVDIPLARRSNVLFQGTHVTNGSGQALVVRTGPDTEFGKISARLRLRPPETEFERGIRRFGALLMEVTLVLVLAIFAINVYFHRPILDAFLFSLALAVGLTPQLLPAIISVNLAHGARRMAAHKVVVRRLASIEDFGSMSVLCSDKTGTLTEGHMRLQAALDASGGESERVFRFAYMNAVYETGFTNPLDEAIRAARTIDLHGCEKLDEVPYDFGRKRLSILVADGDHHVLITKGAVDNVLAACSTAELPDGRVVDLAAARPAITGRFEELGRQGLRTLGVAYRDMGRALKSGKHDETGMVFLGLLSLEDPPKADAAATIQELRRLGVALKIITGDNRLVAATSAARVGLSGERILTGAELRGISDEALPRRAAQVDVFAEIEPNQKERIVHALRKAGEVVGYMGDGINDASALHAADVGISVEGAVDVAKEAADIVLLERDLRVLLDGVEEGRHTFANTLKYVFMATSANFGNMFSMAGASLFLPFLPLLPKQVLLTNLLTDLPEMTIATDSVDPEMLERPRRWNIAFIRRFMVRFGLLSSVFDFLTFGVLLLMRAGVPEFRTAWFTESVVSAALIVLVVRTRRPFLKSPPGRYLLAATLAVLALTLLIPWTPLAAPLGFRRLPAKLFLAIGSIVAGYVLAAEVAKRRFYEHAGW
jgi:Mg2+-importing ATPase